MKDYRIFVINPGSTSTKLALYENEECRLEECVFHDSSVLLEMESINDQLDYRMDVIYRFIEEKNIELEGIDAIVARGGGCYPLESGVYEIDEKLIDDTKSMVTGLYHASMLGVQIAERLHEKYGGIMLTVDPPVVDEYQDVARITGVKGIYRQSRFHALNLKETCRQHAQLAGKKYEDMDFIACHIDGGITITAHRKGKVIDGNDGSGGEGPFTPTRMGTMAVTDVYNYLWDKPKEEIRNLMCESGGLSSYFGTSDADVIHKMVEAGDKKAQLVWRAMIYQISKYIGSMAVVLQGKVDNIILTGRLVRFPDLVEQIRQGCEWIAPVVVYQGELEHDALAMGALRVLRGEIKPLKYPGKQDKYDIDL